MRDDALRYAARFRRGIATAELAFSVRECEAVDKRDDS